MRPIGRSVIPITVTLAALAVTSVQRTPQLPDVPNVSKSGFPGFEVTGWVGISTTARTPLKTIARLEAEIGKAIAIPEVASLLERQGMARHFIGAKEFGAFIDTEIAKFAVAVKYSGAAVD